VLYRDDPFALPTEEVRELRPEMTVVGGRVAYERGA
jgi:predicted amidohydrolase YtcJ